MHILRPYYSEKIRNYITDTSTTTILIHGGRWSGKTTILKFLLSDHSLQYKKYYFSFEDDIVAKKFNDAHDFKWYMQIKYGINFEERNLLLLNEIQYSKNILNILHQLAWDKNCHTIIVATGIIHTLHEEYQTIIHTPWVKTLTIHPLGFFDFLDYKGIHTTYLSLDKPSIVMIKELQWLFDEYLIRWGYPEIIKASSKERKHHQLKAIIQKVYDKDIGFYFYGDEILSFQDLLERICYLCMTGCKYKTIASQTQLPVILIKKYIQFLKDNCIISTLPYFCTDKKRELSHQELIVIEDMGIKNYGTQNFWSQLYNLVSIKNFIYGEISKSLQEGEICMTYQKINNSTIDFIIIHEDDSITPIIVSDSNTNTPPKVLRWFHQQYGHRVRSYIKTTPLTVAKVPFYDKTLVCIPHFMISKALIV